MTNLTDIRSSGASAAGIGTTVYNSVSALPSTGLTSGDQAFVESAGASGQSRLYISNGSGWYNVALINATPRLTLSSEGTIALSSDGTATTITMTALDSDNASSNLTLSVESGGDLFKFATVSQDSSVVTITPRSSDSATSLGYDGSATLTFKATDGISIASVVNTFTLSFSTDWTSVTQTIYGNPAPAADDYFGNNVDISEDGTYVVTSAPDADPGGVSAKGSLSVYLKSGSSYSHQATFTSSDGSANHSIGESRYIGTPGVDGGEAIAIDDAGDRVVANVFNDGVNNKFGKIYVFKRTGTSWAQEYAAVSSNAAAFDQPTAVAISGNGLYVAQGAQFGQTGGDNSGRVTVWLRSGTSWSQQQAFSGSPEVNDGYFGSSVALNTDGTYLAVGARHNDPTGEVYVWTRSGTTWSQQARVQPSDWSTYNNNGDAAGDNVDIDQTGSTIVIGARRHNGSGGSKADSGAIYVFSRSGTSWSQQQGPIYASDAVAGDLFGASVSISKDGNTIAVGAPEADPSGAISGGGSSTHAGKVYVFTRSGTTWSQIAQYKMTNSSSAIIPSAHFGARVAVSGDGNSIIGGAQYYNPTYDGGSNLAQSGAFVMITG